MAREEFDRDLNKLKAELILMGGLVESAVFNSLNALSERNLELSEKVILEDDRIDDKEREVEQACVDLIRREAPVAIDLRKIITVLFVANELERIGDYAEGISKISLMMGNRPTLKELIDIPRMSEIAINMLKRSIEAVLEVDIEVVQNIARSLTTDDDKVDGLYETVQKDLIGLMKKNIDNIERATYLLWAAHNVERIADRAINIAERAVYLATGEIVSL